MKRFLLFILLNTLLAVNTVSGQCLMTPVDLQSRLNNSSLVIEGKVLAQKSFWNKTGNYIFTSSFIEISSVFKGSIMATKLEIITDGGQVELTKQVVEPSLELKPGDVGVFTLNSANNDPQFGYGVYSAYADMQGFIKYDLSDNSAREPFVKYNNIEDDVYGALRSLLNIQIKSGYISGSGNKTSPIGIAAITSFAPTNVTAGTATSLTITGTGFGATQGTGIVEFRNADDGGATFVQPHASQYLSWSSTQIVVQVPSRTTSGTLTTSGTAGTGQIRVTTVSGATLSAQTLTVNYGHLNAFYSNTLTPVQIFNTRHHGPNGAGGITWQMFTGFDANAPARASFLRAFQSWRCATYINWQIGLTTTTNTIALDGVNIIRFDIATELPAGVLGRCTSYFNGCVVGTTVRFYVTELDIVFNDATNWQFGPAMAVGPQFDFESVALHELGHGHQLTHVINNLDVMHFSIANATNKRVLNVDAINGGNAVMVRNLSGAVCGQLIMTALNSTNCAFAAPTASFNLTSPVCVNQSVPLNDLSLGGPTSWLWNMPGGTPATSTLQNTSTTYTAVGIYTVTLITANSSGTSTPISKTIAVVPNPTVSVSGATAICSGNSTTLTASGATSYTWMPGSLTGSVQVFMPAGTTIYTVTGSNGACAGIQNYTVTVNPTPTIAVTAATICTGQTATLTATGATTYTWMPGALTGPTQTFSPAGTTTYTITGVTGSCSSTRTTNINVLSTPTVNVSGTSTICSGNSTTLTATGATSYTWNPGALTGSVQILSPASTTTYIVTGSNGFCSVIRNHTVTVNPSPTITVNSPTICSGNSATLTATGATAYTWNPGALTGSVQVFTPVGTTVYTITGVTGPCASTRTTNITVNTTPTVSVVGTATICSGSSTTLTASGATMYSWNPGALSGSTVVVTPTISTTYSIVGTTGPCSGTRTYTVTVSPSPTINATPSATLICVGQSNTLTASGATTYTWNPGAMSGNPIAVSPTITTIYTVTGTSSLSCTGTRTINVAVSPCTNINASNSIGKINVYPNPTQGNITVDFGSIYTGKISVYNTIGQELLVKAISESESVTIDLSAYAKGIYILRLKSEKGHERSIKIIRD